MHLQLELEELESLIEALDCLKTKIAFTKGLTAAEKKEKLLEAEALEAKLLESKSADMN